MSDREPTPKPPTSTRLPPGPKPLVASLSPDVKFAIRFRYLTDKSSLSDLAQEFGLSTYQVAKVLDGPEYTAMRESLVKVQVQQAKDKLAGTMELAATEWAKSIPIAASQGKHQAARDLLLATGVIKAQGQGNGPSITVIVGAQAGDVTINLGSPASVQPDPGPLPPVVTIDAKALPPGSGPEDS